MARIPNQPQDIFVPLTEDWLNAFGRDLVSLMLYGSAAGGSYVKGKSDINLLVVLTPEGMSRLEDAFAPVKKMEKAQCGRAARPDAGIHFFLARRLSD